MCIRPLGITALAFRMKFFKLLLLAALSATILTGCERRLVSPINPTDPSQTTSQFAQSALSNLADTAAERGFIDLAYAASEVAEVVAMKTGTIAEPVPEFLELALEASALERGFAQTACVIELRKFAIASVHTAKIHVTEITGYEFYGREELRALSAIYPPESPNGMDQALQNLAQEAFNAEATLQRLPTQNSFIPFAFGYGIGIDVYENYDYYYVDCLPHEPGVIYIRYDVKIRSAIETQAAVNEFLINNGYTVSTNRDVYAVKPVNLDLEANLFPIAKELHTIPGVARAKINHYGCDVLDWIPKPPPKSVRIIDRVRTRYNEAWCQGNFDVIDSILIQESGLDFFDYAFVRNLADIYAEEIPEDANLIQTNGFSLRPIGITFLTIYFQHSEKSHEEIIEFYRQSIRDGYVTIEHLKRYVTIEHLKIGDLSLSSGWTVSSE